MPVLFVLSLFRQIIYRYQCSLQVELDRFAQCYHTEFMATALRRSVGFVLPAMEGLNL